MAAPAVFILLSGSDYRNTITSARPNDRSANVLAQCWVIRDRRRVGRRGLARGFVVRHYCQAWAAATRGTVARKAFSHRRFYQWRNRLRNIPGAIVLIQHHGRPVYFKCFGKRDVDKGTPMTADAVFPIHSVTKTITSVAAMMLVDRGKIALD